MRTIVMAITSFVGLALVARPAGAQVELSSHFTGDDAVEMDGSLDEWTDASAPTVVSFVPFGESDRVGGDGPWEGDDDFDAELGLAHNARALFVAFKIKDQRLVRSRKLSTVEDHVELWFGLTRRGGGPEAVGMGVYADPSRSPGRVELRWLKAGSQRVGGKVAGARGAASGDQWSYQVEAAIPWSALPGGRDRRLGLRLAVFFFDCDTGAHMAVKTALGTAPLDARLDPASLPLLRQADLQAPVDAFYDAFDIPADEAPRFAIQANVLGDGRPEEVMVVGRYIVIHGPGLPDPSSYVYRDLPVPRADMVRAMRLEDATGDGRAEIILELRDDSGGQTREWVAIYQVTRELAIEEIFAAATLAAGGVARIENRWRFARGRGRARTIEVVPGSVEGVTRESLGDPPEESGNPMVMPWDEPPRFLYRFNGKRYAREGE